ncbi:MAG: hypothetical protein ACREEB_12110 [Caulobacteraceae bacterium]
MSFADMLFLTLVVSGFGLLMLVLGVTSWLCRDRAPARQSSSPRAAYAVARPRASTLSR